MPHLKRGAIRDFLNIMQEHHYFKDKRWNKSDYFYDFSANGFKKTLEFFSVESADKVRGPRRDILFINEANNVPLEAFNQLEVRTKDIIWLDWNPVAEYWFYTDVLNHRNDLDFIKLTYRDNEALAESIVKSIETRKGNLNWWRVYGEGELGEAEGRIFKGWQLIDDIPHEARLERYGLDFGYTNDPTAIVAIYKYNGGYILDEVAYHYQLSNNDIFDLMVNLDRKLIIADSSEPKSIDELKKFGLNIIGATKGAGSVLQGIQNVQDKRISVTKHSLNIIKEYRNYLWLKDPKTDKILNEPQDFLNHSMDALRYGLDSLQETGVFKMPTDTGGVPGFVTDLG
jgi:phage terminase large subunit